MPQARSIRSQQPPSTTAVVRTFTGDGFFVSNNHSSHHPDNRNNLAFNGQVSLHRKHTKFILDDLAPLVRDAIRGIENLWSQEEQRITAYKATELRRYQAHDLIIEALEAGVCSGAHVPRIVEQWHRPIHDAFAPRTVWSLHNAFTEALKGNLTALPTRTRRLQGLLDPVADFAPPVVVGQC